MGKDFQLRSFKHFKLQTNRISKLVLKLRKQKCYQRTEFAYLSSIVTVEVSKNLMFEHQMKVTKDYYQIKIVIFKGHNVHTMYCNTGEDSNKILPGEASPWRIKNEPFG